MRRLIPIFLLQIILFAACNNNGNNPDVSGVKVDLQLQRLEEDFFNLDTLHMTEGLAKLTAKYPFFAPNFIGNILNTDPTWPDDSAHAYIQGFMNSYRSLYDSSRKLFTDFSPYEKEIKKSLQYVHYYFPKYPIPHQIITYIGPLDGYGDILAPDALIIGLHQHMGANFSMYKTAWLRETYPEYISNRFTPDYIPINSMKNIIADMYPERSEDKSLVIQMVEKGKRLYLLQKLVPSAADYQLIGFTEKQLKESLEREAIIWDLFVQNNLLRTLDFNMIKNYIGDSPKTQELGEASPGNIGSFSGWQIVKKYMSKHADMSPATLMATDAEVIFQEAKYKP